EIHRVYSPHLAPRGAERDRSGCRCRSWRRSWRGCWSCCWSWCRRWSSARRDWFPIVEGILLGYAADDHAPVRPCREVLVEQRGGVVVVAHIDRYDARVGLQRQRGDYVRKRHVGQPGHAVVGGLARPHPVAGGAGAGGLATGRCPLSLVVPDDEEAAVRGDRKIGLPLGLGG